MKKTLLALSFISFSIAGFSQVGIGTDTPTAMLDVAGQVRIRTAPLGTTRQAQDSVLVVDGKGYVHMAPSNITSNLVSFVKASSGSSGGILGVTLLSGWNKIAFNTEEFDTNNDYDSTTDYVYTAPKDGIYDIHARYEASITGLLSASIVSLGIFKQVGAGTPVLLTSDSALVAALLGTSTNTREVQMMAKLNANDKIYFGAQAPLSATVLSSSSDKSYFTVVQVH